VLADINIVQRIAKVDLFTPLFSLHFIYHLASI